MTTKTPAPTPERREIAVADIATDGLAHAHDGQGRAADVAPIQAGTPDDGVPCADCGPALADPADEGAIGIVWTCPSCGSDDLRVLYDERRACRVTTLNDTGDPADAAP